MSSNVIDVKRIKRPEAIQDINCYAVWESHPSILAPEINAYREMFSETMWCGVIKFFFSGNSHSFPASSFFLASYTDMFCYGDAFKAEMNLPFFNRCIFLLGCRAK